MYVYKEIFKGLYSFTNLFKFFHSCIAADVEVNLLDELLDPGVDDELTAELDGQEKKIGSYGVLLILFRILYTLSSKVQYVCL